MDQFCLFLISFFLVFSSSYFLASIFKARRAANSIVFLALILVSQLIISIEVLSLLKQINQTCLLALNFIVFIASLLFWNYKKRPHLDFSGMATVKHKVVMAMSQDKVLLILACFFIFSIITGFILAIKAPSAEWDSMIYHLGRIGFWLQHQTLAHFVTSNVRQLMFPFNSEIFVAWPMIFIKRDYMAGLSQYFAYLGNLFVLFSLLSYLKFSYRRILWAVFILASLPAIILQSSSTQNDTVLAFFLFSSLYLFLYGIREKENKSLIFSAVALSIAFGIKSSVFFFMPAIGIVYLTIAIKNLKKEFYKPLILYSGVFIAGFLILSSYSYILNYLDFGNPLGVQSYINAHTANSLSYKGFIANVIRYFLAFIDSTGIPTLALKLNYIFLFLRELLLLAFGLNASNGLTDSDLLGVNAVIHENQALFGLFGLLILPAVIIYGLTRIFSGRDRTFTTGLISLIILIFILTIAAFMGYERWNHRYLVTAMALSSSILVFTYRPGINVFKILICLIAIFNYTVIPTCNVLRPIFPCYGRSIITDTRDISRFSTMPDTRVFYNTIKYLRQTAPDNSKIALILSCDDWYYHFFHENPNWKIYSFRYENFIKEPVKYDFLVISREKQYVYNPNPYKKPDKLITDIDFSRIPVNYKLVQVIKPHPEDKLNGNYYIYKNFK